MTITRYCPECGMVGPVNYLKNRDCCPDGAHALMVPKVIAKQASAGYKARNLLGLQESQLRKAFEQQHQGRRLEQHSLRGTYLSPPMAALWNQHKRTVAWFKRELAEAMVGTDIADPE